MKISTIDKTEKITMGKVYELRGNFKEVVNEDGEVSYIADMFRTSNKTDTFEKLFKADEIAKKKAFLKSANYIANNFSILNDSEKEDFLVETSDTFNITNKEIITKMKQYRKDLNSIL